MESEHERLMALSEDQIFAEIGWALLGEQFGTVRLSDDEAARAGRCWFQSILPMLKERICGNPMIAEQLLCNAAVARNTVLLVSLDTLLSGMFAGLPVATISHAVVLYGIYRLCEGTMGDGKS